MENSLIKTNFRSVISLVDKLRDIKLQSYIQLPKIVAVGSQSSGKSSLIQQIVGLDFLPRGSGVVTRRPLQIRMVYQEGLKQSYACFQQIPNKKFTDFSKVKTAIQQVTDNVCGKDKNIVDKAIVMYIYSSNNANLTVIDLPGLTRISLGSQVQNIHQVTKNMIKKYMVQQNTIILCVIPANQDITNDQVLYMARQIDVHGQRTIGCITKIDIMDRGTDSRALLMNKGQVPLKLGYVGIKNRSQADINENKTVKQSLQDQKNFFSKSPIYSSLSPYCLGTTSLVQKMTKVLESCILSYLPTLLQKIRQKKSVLSEKIKLYGKPLPKSLGQRQSMIWQLCNQYILNYKNALRCIPSTFPAAQRIQKVSFHIQQGLKDILLQQSNEDFKGYLSDKKIHFALKKFDTINQLGFPSMNTFLYLLNPILNDLKMPMQNTLMQLCDNISHLSQLIASQVTHQFKQFKQYLILKNSQIIAEFKRKANQFLLNILESQIKGVTYQKLDFDRKVDQTTLTQLQMKNPLIPIMRTSIVKYYERCVKNLRQVIPKNFHYLLLNQATKKIQFEIFQSCIGSQDKIQKWLQLSSYSKQQRIHNEKQFEVIQKAQQHILTYGGFSKAVSIKKNKKRQQRQKQLQQITEKQKQKRRLKQIKADQQKKQLENSKFLKSDSSKVTEAKTQISNKTTKQQPAKVAHTNVKQHQVHTKKDHHPVTHKKQEKVIQKPVVPEQKQGVFAALFGMSVPETKKQQKQQGPKQPPQQTSARKPIFPQQFPENQQGLTQKYNQQAGKATDKGVDQVFKNQKFQQQSKKAVQKGASIAVQKQFGLSEQTGKLFGQGAGMLWGNQKVQNAAKQEAKKQARDKTQM